MRSIILGAAIAVATLVPVAPAGADEPTNGTWEVGQAQPPVFASDLVEVLPGVHVAASDAPAVLAYLDFLYWSEPVEVLPGVTVPRSEEADVRAYLRAMSPSIVDRYRPVMDCIAHGESGGSYVAKNPRSTASGFLQFLDTTWHTAAMEAGFPEWANSPARYAPAWIQDEVGARYIERHGLGPWAASAANRRCSALLP